MKRNWVVVANAARARLFEDAGEAGGLKALVDMVHTQSRQKGIALAGDRPGHVEGQGHGLGSAAYVPRTDAREREHDRFAREVAAALDDAVAAGRCAGIVLVASNPFLGHLKAHLGAQAAKAVLRTVASDYTTLREGEIAQRLHTEPVV